jgi:hypothetical protein
LIVSLQNSLPLWLKILLPIPFVCWGYYRWTPQEIDFVDWVFNASPVLKERAEMMALHEGMTYERDAEKRAPYAQRSLDFIDRITDTLSKKMIRKLKNRWDVEIWPWDREGFQRPKAPHHAAKRQR